MSDSSSPVPAAVGEEVEASSSRRLHPMRTRLFFAAVCFTLFAVLTVALDRDLITAAMQDGRALTEDDRVEIARVVRLYNSIYQDFHASGGNPALIDQFPTSKSLKHYVFRDIGYLRDAGLVQVYDLASFEVVEITGRGDRAEAVTKEAWNHVLQRRADRGQVAPIRGLDLAVRYLLERRHGRWTVVAWDPEPVADRAEAGDRPGR